MIDTDGLRDFNGNGGTIETEAERLVPDTILGGGGGGGGGDGFPLGGCGRGAPGGGGGLREGGIPDGGGGLTIVDAILLSSAGGIAECGVLPVTFTIFSEGKKDRKVSLVPMILFRFGRGL